MKSVHEGLLGGVERRQKMEVVGYQKNTFKELLIDLVSRIQAYLFHNFKIKVPSYFANFGNLLSSDSLFCTCARS